MLVVVEWQEEEDGDEEERGTGEQGRGGECVVTRGRLTPKQLPHSGPRVPLPCLHPLSLLLFQTTPTTSTFRTRTHRNIKDLQKRVPFALQPKCLAGTAFWSGTVLP